MADDRRPFHVDPITGQSLQELARRKDPILKVADWHEERETDREHRIAWAKRMTIYLGLFLAAASAVTLLYRWGEFFIEAAKAAVS